MATIHTLKTQYSAVMRVDYAAISTADSTLLADLAAKVDASAITLGAATAEIAKLAINTTTVANLSYYFFTGATPRAGGLDYLISPTGGNPNNLNASYYQSFNMENRFINFAVNLGKTGEGATGFTAAYGALSLSEATTKAYTTIFGFAPAAGKIAELLDAQVPNGLGGTYARSQYFAAIGLDGATGQGTKAAMVGWLMAEAAKANLGAYVTANNAFLADLMDDGAALFNVDLLGAYGVQPAHPAGASIAVTASQSVTLEASDAALRATTGNDTVTGTVSNAGQTLATGEGNDTITFTGAVGSLIDGEAGNDTITVAQLNASVPVLGGAANGTINGGAGNDVITVGKAADGVVIDGGAGDDTLIIGMDVEFFSKTVIKNVEHVVFDNAKIQFGGIKTTDMVGLKDVTVHSTDGLRLDDLANGVALNLDAQTGGVVTANYHTELVFVGGHASQTVGVSSVTVNLDGVISPTAKPTDLKVTGNHGPLILNVQSDSALGAVTSEGPGVSGVVHVEGSRRPDRQAGRHSDPGCVGRGGCERLDERFGCGHDRRAVQRGGHPGARPARSRDADGDAGWGCGHLQALPGRGRRAALQQPDGGRQQGHDHGRHHRLRQERGQGRSGRGDRHPKQGEQWCGHDVRAGADQRLERCCGQQHGRLRVRRRHLHLPPGRHHRREHRRRPNQAGGRDRAHPGHGRGDGRHSLRVIGATADQAFRR